MNKRCQKTDDGGLVAWTLLLETHAALTTILESEFDEIGGLPLGWYDVLVQLEMSPEGRLTMKQLSQGVLLSKSGITRLVDRMERAGMIERAACPSDRRVVYARATEEGRTVFRKAAPIHLRGIREHFSGLLSPAEIETLRGALTKVLDSAQATGCREMDRRAAG